MQAVLEPTSERRVANSHDHFQVGVRLLRMLCEHWGIRDAHEAARRLYPLVADQTNDEERERMVREFAYPVNGKAAIGNGWVNTGNWEW